VTDAPNSTNPNATRGDSWCRRYVVAPHRLIPVPADAPLPAAEPMPEWLKRSKPLTHPLPLPPGYGSSAASPARKPRINAGRLIRAAKKAGLTVERVESDQDGKISVTIAKPGAASEPVSVSDLDDWLAKRRKKAKDNANQS
jgi:hypothetical protein